MTQASVRLRPYGTISGAVLTRARLPIARIFGEVSAAKELVLLGPQNVHKLVKFLLRVALPPNTQPLRSVFVSYWSNHRCRSIEAASRLFGTLQSDSEVGSML